MTGTLHALRLAARSLGRHTGLAAIAVVTLALGIGSTTFMFSIVHGALYRGLPFPDGDRIMRVAATNRAEGWERSSVEFLDYLAYRSDQSSFQDLAGGYTGTLNVGLEDGAIRLDGGFMTANAFDVLRVKPAMGRAFLPGDDAPGAPAVIVLSHETWRDEFGADPDIAGRSIRVNGEASTVIGVMPEGFAFPEVQQAWVPLRRDPLAEERGEETQLLVYGRLRNDVGPERAQADLSRVADRLAVEFPETNEHVGVNVFPFTDMGSETRAILLTLLAAVTLILLVACTNVANLLLARTATRTRDIAVRTALGAGRGRLVGQLVAEAAVLAGIGALLGTGIAALAMRWFRHAIAHTEPPFWFVFAVDGPILVFVVLVTGVAAIASGVIPGLKATGADVQGVLQDDSRGSSSLRLGRLSRGLVMGEIALSVALLVVAGLMAKGILLRRSLDLPFATESVFTARIGLFETEFPDPAARQRLYDELLRDLAAEPAVEAVALTNSLPGLYAGETRVAVQGVAYADDEEQPRVRHALVSPGFFRTFQVDAVRGRVFHDGDRDGATPVAIVNESFAARHFDEGDAVGRQIRAGAGEDADWRTIVGVVPDLAMEGLQNEIGADASGLYVPLAQDDARFVSIAVRSRGEPMAITPSVHKAVLRLAPDTPLYWVRTLDDAIARQLWAVDVFGGIMIVFGLAALVMAVAGLYAVTAFSVSRRTREVGIRMAMGAAARDVLGMIIRQGAVQIAVGLSVGLALAAALAMALRDILFRVTPLDPAVYAAIALILAAAALTASAVPGYRASRVDPAHALHGE